MSLADDSRKRMKRKELRNQKLASKPQKRSYYGDHVAYRRPKKMYEEERAKQPKTCQQTSKTIIMWGSHHLPTTQENVRRGKSCVTKNLPVDLENNRTIEFTSCTKMLANGPRKRMKREKLRNQKLISRPRK
ncbi:hypothetical protein PanWU01x14_072710 [Parasponia andersonii]|uniref:Uncharacterized protein n=1 Tax=Parasponia andersonii TaxID=3476 RepID=A0A2P5DDV5_PARAD|nr:hypothetical protein PanWU01x14_072710 [Parasponia andersonii]